MSRRRYKVALWVGIIAGIVGAIVKFGWEVPLPPRTPERNAVNPPQELLKRLGLTQRQVQAGYTYNGNGGLPWVSFLVHFGFSVSFAAVYCVMAERFPRIKAWQGVGFGLAVWIGFHLIVMPALKVVPSPRHQPWQEHLSEALGHAVWMWVIEVIRRDLRNRVTGEPDAEAG